MLHQYLAPLLGFAFGILYTPLVISVANRYGLLDVPADSRRIHPEAVPRLGGVAIFFATICATASLYAVDWVSDVPRLPMPFGRLLPGLMLGATIVFLTGILDDLRGVAPRFKLVAQTAAALAVVAYGLTPQGLALAPGTGIFALGWLGIPLVVVWIVGVTNAFNLIDGVDGLAGTFALIGLATCAIADVLLHGGTVLTISLAMAGAVIAFLQFNRNPARIFLGDSGSMTIGFFLAVKSVVSATGPGATVYFLIPLAALTFPIVDTFISIARRWLRGHPLSRADGRHVHHMILALGLSPVRTVQLLGFVFAGFASLGLSVVFAPPQLTLALLVAAPSLDSPLYSTAFDSFSTRSSCSLARRW